MRVRKKQTRALYAIDQAWRGTIKAELKARDWSLADLANAIGVSPSNISQLLDDKGKLKSSKWVPKIHEALGLPPPQAVQAMTARQYRWNQLGLQLDAEHMDHLLELGEAIARRSKL